ncbi:unnamed protein product [Leptosia nina]|uniref:Large ribosomal subunit protein bL35m n=1 Tax=Leptosia nina TaxID=320188 RepID=A0AAV1IYA1_9NEOP
MFRCSLPIVRGLRQVLTPYYNVCKTIANVSKNHSTVVNNRCSIYNIGIAQTPLVQSTQILDICNKIEALPIRSVTKFSKKGKRKTVKAVIDRFFRLHWGGWIRTKVGRHKKIWKKSQPQRRRLRQHVFCNSTQSTLLDKMVTKFWKKPKYYVEDPYAPYHTREEFYITRKKPMNH